MKSYEEVADAVFERREAYISEKAKKMKTVKRTVSAVSCFCLAVLLGVGVWQIGMLDTSSPAPAEGGSAVTAGETAYTMNSPSIIAPYCFQADSLITKSYRSSAAA